MLNAQIHVTDSVLKALVGLVLLCPLLWAQQGSSSERPLTGLVLSGGGARGCAHVGVLKVLEELRIPVDFIAGTSMGSIVGGCYAYGYSPEQIEIELVRRGGRRPWSQLLTDDPKRHQLAFRRKQEQRSFLGDFDVGIRDGRLKFPRGLLQGQNLELELRQLVPEAHDLATFDELPIPFRAVAVDLADGAGVILGEGSLVEAMRASMSLPGIFSPVERDGALLIDGGIVNNVPMDVAKAMGATRLIVVDIGTPVTPAEISSALDVTVQMVGILTQQNVTAMLGKLSDDDLLIQPDLGELTSADFEKAAQLIELGEKAARAAIPQLRRYATSETEWVAFLERQRRPQRDIVINSIRVQNFAGFDDRVISRRIRAKAGIPLDVEELRQDLELLYGTGDYESLQYRLENGNGNRRDLTIEARNKSWGPTFLRFGIALESDIEGQSAFNLGGQINVRQIGPYSAEWRTDLQLGDESRVASEFFQPLGPASPFFIAPRVAASTFDVDTFENGQRTGAFDVETGSIGLDMGMLLGTSGEIRVGYTRTTGSVDPSFATQTIPGFNFDDATMRASLGFDTLDHVNFPRWGTAGEVAWEWADEAFGADVDYQSLTTSGAWAVSRGPSTAIVRARFEATLENRTPLFAPSILGGFSNLSGLQRNELSGQHLGLVSLVLRQRLSGKHADTLTFPVYVGGTIEAGNAWQNRDDVWRDLRMAGSVYLAVDTPVGPTYLAYGLAEGGEDSVYLFVGQIF